MRVVTEDAKARFELSDEEIAYWDSLSVNDQEAFHNAALHEIRHSIMMENFYGALGQRGWTGKGSALGEAVHAAYLTSPEYKARLKARQAAEKEARENEPHECYECHSVVPFKRALVAGDVALCFDCARTGPLAHLVPDEG